MDLKYEYLFYKLNKIKNKDNFLDMFSMAQQKILASNNAEVIYNFVKEFENYADIQKHINRMHELDLSKYFEDYSYINVIQDLEKLLQDKQLRKKNLEELINEL